MNIIKSKKTKLRAGRTFLKKGTCSRTFFYVLNREFGHLKDAEEQAIDPLAGGILQQGYQCGMLWGASMGIGAEAHRQNNNPEEALAITISATQYVMKSFENRTKSIDCSDVTHTDFTNNWSFAKYMLSGKFTSCFVLAGKWGPEAVDAAKKGLSLPAENNSFKPRSCASETIKMMGGTEEEMTMVAGFAGGLGLRGDGCGALAAAIWYNSLQSIKSTGKPGSYKPESNEVLQIFNKETQYDIECKDICGRTFNSIDEHSEYIENGGCAKLIEALAKV